MKKAGSSILGSILGFILIGALGFLVISGSRLFSENNSMQRTAKIALEDYLAEGRELPVGEYVSYEVRWVLGPFATETETQSVNGFSATTGVKSYYYLFLGEPDSPSLMALEVENVQDNKTLEEMSDWLEGVEDFPQNGKTLKVQGKLSEMKDAELRKIYSSGLGVSPNDPAVRYLVLDTTAGRDGIFLIIDAVAVAALVIVVIVKKTKKKAQTPVPEPAPVSYDPEIQDRRF